MSKILYVEKEHGGHAGNMAPEMDFVPASRSEIIEALGIDYQAAVLAAAGVIERWFGPDDTDEGDGIEAEVVKGVLDAALGLDDDDDV